MTDVIRIRQPEEIEDLFYQRPIPKALPVNRPARHAPIWDPASHHPCRPKLEN